jgi:hypothetical protein
MHIFLISLHARISIVIEQKTRKTGREEIGVGREERRGE